MMKIISLGTGSFTWIHPRLLPHGQNCSYDALNRRTSCADTQDQAEGKSRSTTYNASGAVLTQVDTKGAVTSNSYDLRDRLVATTERATGVLPSPTMPKASAPPSPTSSAKSPPTSSIPAVN